MSLYRRKLDTCCQAMRQFLNCARLQPHASKMHLKWAVIVTVAPLVWTVTYRWDVEG